VAGERALVFGSSAGAEVGLELAKNHPGVVDGLVAHEPPVVRVLPDADEFQTRVAEIYRTAWTEGSKAAFFDFLLLTQLPFNNGKPAQRPQRGHRPHGKPATAQPRHAHAGPKQHRSAAGKPSGGRRDSRA
jgi:pimeloyl-ACP methyl ester carboxylesterase